MLVIKMNIQILDCIFQNITGSGKMLTSVLIFAKWLCFILLFFVAQIPNKGHQDNTTNIHSLLWKDLISHYFIY